jgi:NAD(P)-dependent dehydrogenase (short-subunit alcohol dehydrogenase family)
MGRLDGRVALVTGAAHERGIGQGIALALAEEGADVALNDVAFEDMAQAAVERIRALGRRALHVPADVADRDAVDAMFARVEAELGPVDIACSNAGVADWEPWIEISRASLDRIVGVNLTGAFNVGQQAARRMIAGGRPGRIVFTSSVHVQMCFPQMAVYGATKQSLRALAETMAIELGPHGITVNHIGPGWVRSQLNDRSPGLRTEDDERATLALIPLPRPSEASEQGRAVVYLASSDGDYVTGEFLRVDGGFVVGKY